MNFSRIIFFFLFFIATKNSVAQGGFIKTEISKNKILIGEQVLLNIEIRLQGSTPVSSFKLDSIPHFEILEEPSIDTSNNDGNTVIKAIYKITSFDSGHWVIPEYTLSPAIKSDSIPVDVMYADVDPNKDYNDIKDIIEVKPPEKTKWWLYAIAGALVVAVVVIYFLRKKKITPAVIKPTAIINAYEEAMKELETLKRSKPEPKLFYSTLTGIFRLYIYRKKGILSLQKTTDDLVLQLKSLNMDKVIFEKLAQCLRLSDFVKFAKYIPSTEDDETAFNSIGESIEEIERTNAVQLA